MSTIRERISNDMKTAMKAKDKVRLGALRMLKAEIIKKETEAGAAELSEAEFMQLLQTMKKQRDDSIAQFEKGGRDDLAANERAELTVIESYLPKALTDEELAAVVTETAQELGATEKKDMGRLMKALKEKVAGAADGKRMSEAVKSFLN
ncbi:GatB/YqeY domain-containing protein [Acanthopleuribacter pedis]|uniref:GatB/YqeY domain-containing protein n=1 Tax=Acanthopleuribacter pedis TaxID=442870 RepID=A0A8J7U644_9BACT|nr:GatB/YqeY domain-containing protein [Acanthopleuribacter pedis]MBO1321148.1 GatB/YqeY domain-containing protein [Acanthopleuribacter pedis]